MKGVIIKTMLLLYTVSCLKTQVKSIAISYGIPWQTNTHSFMVELKIKFNKLMKIRLKQQTTFMSGLFYFLTLTLGFLFRVMDKL